MDPSPSQTTTTVVAEPVVDAVESLRAAALSTLRTKRRKPASVAPPEKAKPTPPPKSRPRPKAETVQLDYGGLEEDKAAGAFMAMAVDEPESKGPAKVKGAHRPKHRKSREEGEISDEEEPPPLPVRQSMTRSPVPGRKVSSGAASAAELQKLNIEDGLDPLNSGHAPMTPLQSHSAPMEGILETPDHLALAREEAEIADSLMMDDSDYSQSVSTTVLLDADHVRPGLRITQEEYDTIKSLILDLLGWGVTVDYLLESGVNKHVIYYVFNELNLRLPDDFDDSGIVPYTPDFFSQTRSISMVSMPRHSIASISPARINGRNPVIQSSANLELLDRERRQREELLARKAARASSRQQARPVIKTESLDSISALDVNFDSGGDIVMSPAVVPVEAVDDFLNSIGPVEGLRSAPSSLSREASFTNPAMDVDYDAEMGQVIEYNPRSAGVSEYTTPLHSGSSSGFRFSEPPPSSNEPPPSSIDSAATSFSRMSSIPKEELVTPSAAQIIPPKMVRAATRRPTNRPVASDFVDFHGESSRLPPSATNLDNRNGRTTIARPLRKHTSFSKVGIPRRCVIDLSDSEDEHGHTGAGASNASNGQPQMPVPTLANQRRDSGRSTWNSKFAMPAASKPVTPSVSPAILEQKELEIRKMREMIAQREEETRQKKLAMAKAASGSDSPPKSLTPTQPFVVPKQEEIEVAEIPPPDEPDAPMEVDHLPDVPPSPSSVASTPPATRIELPIEEPVPVIPKEEPSVLQTNGDNISNITDTSTLSQLTSSHPDILGEPQAIQSPSSKPQERPSPRPPSAQQSVDADVNMSSSTQMIGSSTTATSPAPQQTLQKPDARSPPSSSSTPQNEPDAFSDKFTSYHSLSESYPGLFHRPERDPDSFSFSRDSPSFFSSSEPSSLPFYSDRHFSGSQPLRSSSAITAPSSRAPVPDLKPLKLLAAAKLFDPASRICQFEIPGGGVCRDAKCTDIHLSRFQGTDGKVEVKPSDRDTAQYLFDTLPRNWLTVSGITSSNAILRAIQQIDQTASGGSLSFDNRVARALLSFEPRPMT